MATISKITVGSTEYEINDATALHDINGDNEWISASEGSVSHIGPSDTAGTYGTSSAQAPAFGATFNIPYVSYDAKGHISGGGTSAVALPAAPSDTKVTNTLSNSTKFYVTGTTSSSTNTGTQNFDSGVFVTTNAGELQATTLNATGSVKVGSFTLAVSNDILTIS